LGVVVGLSGPSHHLISVDTLAIELIVGMVSIPFRGISNVESSVDS